MSVRRPVVIDGVDAGTLTDHGSVLTLTTPGGSPVVVVDAADAADLAWTMHADLNPEAPEVVFVGSDRYEREAFGDWRFAGSS